MTPKSLTDMGYGGRKAHRGESDLSISTAGILEVTTFTAAKWRYF